MNNPFPISGYQGPENFCDRQEELAYIQKTIKNGQNLTLHSIRRMGKTGLINHYYHYLNPKKYLPIYIDIYKTQSIEDFTNTMISAISEAYDKRFSADKWINQLTSLFKGMNAKVSFDPYTGMPKLSINFQDRDDVIKTLETTFKLLSEKKTTTVIAIDEFQQIERYEDKGIPALIREQMQRYQNIKFILLGSERHLLMSMFNADQPLFRMTTFMQLDKIDHEDYQHYIREQFKGAGKIIDDALIDDILQWTNRHTYYVQEFCNRLYANSKTKIEAEDLRKLKFEILKTNEIVFYNYRNLLTSNQWKLLKAIAKEGIVHEPSRKEFLIKHKLGAGSTVRSALKVLLSNDLIYADESISGISYQVYDQWHKHWLANI